MSIYSIRAVGTGDVASLAQNRAQQVDVQAFSRLLRQQTGATTVSALTGASAGAQVDVAASLAAAQQAYDAQYRARMSVAHLSSENIVDVADAALRQGALSSTGYWTGQVDTSDGMIEKAAPYMHIIQDASAAFNIPCNVIMGVIKAESDYQPGCVSHSGAKGLMQIMPCNEEYYGVSDPFDARENIFCGTHEIADLLNRYGGDLRLALAAYNTGPTRIANLGVRSSQDAAYMNVPASVRAYADRVLRYAGLSA